MEGKIKLGGVSYLNTKPLLYGVENGELKNKIDLKLDYPARVADALKKDELDIGLLPVAAMKTIPGARIVCDYGIAADGRVASVALFSQVPVEEIEAVYLDYQSRTSVRLAQLLFEKHWKKKVIFKQATEHYIENIQGNHAGVIIGDRALKQLRNFDYVYDLAEGWKEMTGLPFVFAAWVANKDISHDFIQEFNQVSAEGLNHIDEIVAQHPFPWYDLKTYFTENVHYLIDEEKRKGMELFLSMLK